MADPAQPEPTPPGDPPPKKRNRANIRKRPKREDSDDDDQARSDAGAPAVQRPKHRRAFDFSTNAEDRLDLDMSHAGNRAIQERGDRGATRGLETETEFDRDARAQREKILKQGEDGAEDINDGKYRGMHSYIDYRKGFRKEHTIAAEKSTGAHGPLRANVYVRTSIRVDYQPDLCKDYKETGFCSYGDSCKFLHDRGDYKSGWELEREYEARKKQEQGRALARALGETGEGDDDEEDSDDDLPFACYTCRKPWAESGTPVVTPCKHYFCERCALKGKTKTLKCAVCGQSTRGIFNVAHDVMKRANGKMASSSGKGKS